MMAYSEKYIISFISERGNDYRIVILQQNYTGEAVQKKLGVAPVLSVESGDGRIQGSSLAFSIQSDTEGELRGLYTTNNKEFKALLYRNGVLYWQGYLLPELYSENYIYPPYDVAVTATDQLATLKDVAYAGEDAQTSLLDIIKNILSHTQINLQCKVHMNLNDSNGISVLRGSYISAATYNGQSCYDALNAILLSCNCTIMQMGNQWLITSFTDYSYSYDLEGSEVLEAHATIGQMHQGDVWPSGSLNMVNAPALKGAKVDYNHTLRNSFLKNADITSREDWMYTPDPKDNELIPGIVEAIDGKKYKCFFWQLFQHNIAEDNSLRLWQDVRLSQDPGQVYSISLKYLFSVAADLLLLSVTYYGDNGQTYRLTGEGWTTNFSNSNLSSYIQITGKQQNVPYIWDVADMSKYETATVQFELPATSGSIRIGFINSTADYAEPTNRPSSINVTQVYFTVSSVTGQTATTEVEKMATSAQEELELGYGDKASTINGDQLVLNTLRDAEGAAKSVWNLSGREFPSYYMAMLQEYSRYYGSKKMQLQGVVMGKDAFRAFYIDSFSGLVMRLLSGQYNLLEDEVNISLEEVVTAYVDYDTVVYATDNKPQQNTSSSAGTVVSGGGATTLGGLINVDDNVDEVDTEVQVMIKDIDSKVWGKKPLDEVNFNEKKTSEYLVTNNYLTRAAAGELYAPASMLDYFTNGAANNALKLGGQLPEYYATNSVLTAVSDRVTELEKLFYYDAEHDAVRTSLSLIVDQWLTFGGAAMGSGSVTGATTLAGLNDVQITEPADGQSLVYDATLGKWVNKVVSGGVSGDYLPITGGTLVSPSTNVLVVKTSLDNDSWIRFENSKGILGYIGFDSSTYNPCIGTNIGAPYFIIHSGNYSSYALPITGGTINSTTETPLIVNTTNSTNAYIRIDINNSGKAAFGWNPANGAFIYNWQGGDYLRVGDDHHPYFNDKVLLHSANTTDAIVDGITVPFAGTINSVTDIWSSFKSKKTILGSMYYQPESKWYNVISIRHRNGTGDGTDYGMYIATTLTEDGSLYWNKQIAADKNIGERMIIDSSNIGSQSVNYANSAGVLSSSYANQDINLARNESKIRLIYSTANNSTDLGYPIQYSSGISVLSDYTGWQMVTYGSTTTPNPFFRLVADNGSWLEWKQLAFLTDNVASATKLQTTRTLWGQSFDGSGNVTGSLEVFSTGSNWSEGIRIHPAPNFWSGIILCESSNSGSTGTSANTWSIHNNEGTFGIYKNGSSTAAISYISNVSNNWMIGGGNVLIGTTTDYGSKLYVKSTTASQGAIAAFDSSYSNYGYNYTNMAIMFNGAVKGSWGWNNVPYSLGTQYDAGIFLLNNISGSGINIYDTGEILVRTSFMRTLGNFVADGSVTFNLASDRRLKSNIRPLTYRNTMRVLHRLRPVSFEWNETAVELDSSRQGLCDGFIADEYEGLIPNSGRDIWEKYRAIDYTRAIPYLAKGWQIHESELDKMRGRVKDLEKEVKQLKKLLYKHNIIAA